jgi:hypothetical protein
LGLSKTSTSIGWVLVDECNVAGDPLDHDAFDITDASTAAPVATARRVRDIATASGYTVDSVHVTSSGNLSSLRDALTQLGFHDVVPVSLTAAIRGWAMDVGRANGQRTIAVCILGQDSASLSVLDTSSGAIETATTTASRDCVALSVWLNASFGLDKSQPEALYLIGSRSQLAAIADKLDSTLSVPVVATHDAQLALARGAATSSMWHVVDHCGGVSRSGFASQARTFTAVALVAVVSLFTLSSAGSPVTLAQRSVAQPAPPAAAPPAPPEAFPPPPAPAAEPMTEALPTPATIPQPAAVPATVQVAPPVEHLPDVQSVEHIPDAQSALAPGPIAPGPAQPDQPAAALTPGFGDLP